MIKRILFRLFILALILIVAVYVVNSYVIHIGDKDVVLPENVSEITDADCILVLGCGIKPSGKPSDMLLDRLERGVELYWQGTAPKIIMSGDHGRKEYDEVNVMKKYAVDAKIPSSDIFMDHAGFSTYDSIYRAKEIFKAKKIIVVSQEYHLYRALYIANKLGVIAYGVNADYHTYVGQQTREIREVLARCKDFIKTIIKPKPTYLGEAIPVSGNGNITND